METELRGTQNVNNLFEDSFEDGKDTGPATHFQAVKQHNLSTKLLNSHSTDPLYQSSGAGLIPDASQLPNTLWQSLLDGSAMNSDAFQPPNCANSTLAEHQSESPMNETVLQEQPLNQFVSGRQSRLQATDGNLSSPRATSSSPPNCQTSSSLSSEAIIYNEQTQEYTMNDPIHGAQPIKINYQNIVNRADRSYYKVVREQLIPIVNQSDFPSLGSFSGFQSEQVGKENWPSAGNLLGQQVLNSTTFNWTANSPLNQLLLANQDNLCGLQSSAAKQPKSPDPIDNNILTTLGDQAFQTFLAKQLTNIFSATLNATGDEVKSEHLHPIGSTPVKASKKTKTKSKKSSKDAATESKSKKSSKDTATEPKNESSGFQCPHCPKLCGSKGGLTSHLKQHNKDLPFACTVCPARFSHKGPFTNHLKTHKDKLPFTCTICPDKGFIDKEALETHMNAEHGDPKPFACDQCEKSYSSKRALSAHQQSHERARQKSRKESGGKKDAKEPAMEVDVPAVDGDGAGRGEQAAGDSSGVRFSSMLSDAELDLNVVIEQPGSE